MGIKRDKIGLFLSSFGAVLLSLSLLIGLYNFGLHTLTLVPAGIGLLITSIGVILSFDFWKSRFSKKSSHYSLLSFAYIGLTIVIILTLNFAIQQKSLRWDFSSQSVNTLSQQSQEILKNLKDDVRITIFLEKSDPRFTLLKSLAELYEDESSKLHFRFFSPKFDVKEARQYQITQDSAPFIIERSWQDRQRLKQVRFRIKMQDLNREEIITNAIMRVTSEHEPQVVILGGHGELDPLNTALGGMSDSFQLLKNEGYQVLPLNLMAARQLPQDVSLVIIPGVKTSFLEPERRILQNYVAHGGHLLLMLEPQSSHGLDQILNDFGVMANNDLILDVSPFAKMYGERTAVSLQFADHILTRKFQNTMCLFPGARSLSVQTGKKGVLLTEILKTGEKSWGESNFVALEQGEAEWQLGEVKGPVTLAVAGEKTWNSDLKHPSKNSRYVIIGDADFIANENLMQGANRNFFLNATAWLSDSEEKITVRPRVRGHNQILLTPNQRDGIAFFVLQLLPTLILAMGLGLYFSRKEQ